MSEQIEKLKTLLASIPATGAINRARRQAILNEIWRLEAGA